MRSIGDPAVAFEPDPGRGDQPMMKNRFFAGAAFVLAIALVVGFLPACDEEKKPVDQDQPAKELPGGAPADTVLTDKTEGDGCGGCAADAAADAMVPATDGCGDACGGCSKDAAADAMVPAAADGCGGCADEKTADGCGGCSDAQKAECGKDCTDCDGSKCADKKAEACSDCPGGCSDEQKKKCAEKAKGDCCGTCGGDS